MPMQVCGASKTTRLHYSPVAPVAEFPHPDSFRTCDSQPALLLPLILAAGEGEMGLQGLGGHGGALQEPELASWGGGQLSWPPEGGQGPPPPSRVPGSP